MATDPHRQEQRTKRGYGSIEDGVKIVNYEDSEVSASAQHAQSTSSAPPFSTNRWLQFGSFCAGLVLVASLVGHRAILAAHVVKVSGIKEAGGGGGVTTGGGGEPNLFLNQMVDHFDPTNNATWSHPYFVSGTHFAGPGHPILVILGGEGPVTNILYPFVSTKLAKEFGAYVLQTEHRFYGNSQPVGFNATNHELDLYLAPEQALADWIRIIRHVQVKLGCSLHNKTSSSYCPVITIGGSYPGFLSAMMRLNYPSVVDIGYASSAPLKLYEHSPNFDADGYYDFVTKVAEEASPGCANGVKSTLEAIHDHVVQSPKTPTELALEFGICVDSFPEYIVSNDIFAQELTMLVVASNADFNMDYYPPTNDTDLVKACRIFSGKSSSTTFASPAERYSKFLQLKQGGDDYQSSSSSSCFDLQTEIAAGPNATISSADWSGAGDGDTARSWEFQICRDLVVETGYGPNSMFFPPREFSLTWLTDHCMSRFAVKPQPRRLVRMWHFQKANLVNQTSRILFTNGLRDGWSVSSYTSDLSDSILALNFPNGAHHSDLIHEWPSPDETEDLAQGHEDVIRILRMWLIALNE